MIGIHLCKKVILAEMSVTLFLRSGDVFCGLAIVWIVGVVFNVESEQPATKIGE